MLCGLTTSLAPAFRHSRLLVSRRMHSLSELVLRHSARLLV